MASTPTDRELHELAQAVRSLRWVVDDTRGIARELDRGRLTNFGRRVRSLGDRLGNVERRLDEILREHGVTADGETTAP